MKPDQPLDAEYRVLGEPRWAPFNRWCAEMWWKLQASALGQEAAGWFWPVRIVYVSLIALVLWGGVVFAKWFNAFLWRLVG